MKLTTCKRSSRRLARLFGIRFGNYLDDLKVADDELFRVHCDYIGVPPPVALYRPLVIYGLSGGAEHGLRGGAPHQSVNRQSIGVPRLIVVRPPMRVTYGERWQFFTE
jgi:hypothetical protein